MDISISKTGKHGTAKTFLLAVDSDGKKVEHLITAQAEITKKIRNSEKFAEKSNLSSAPMSRKKKRLASRQPGSPVVPEKKSESSSPNLRSVQKESAEKNSAEKKSDYFSVQENTSEEIFISEEKVTASSLRKGDKLIVNVIIFFFRIWNFCWILGIFLWNFGIYFRIWNLLFWDLEVFFGFEELFVEENLKFLGSRNLCFELLKFNSFLGSRSEDTRDGLFQNGKARVLQNTLRRRR
jgi:hypothetical protein